MSDFLSSVFTWEALFSNIIWSLMISAGFKGVLWLMKKPVSNRLYWAIFPVFVLILLSAANYITGGRSRLNEPHISGKIEGVNVAPVPDSNDTYMLLIVSLYNSGAPSFADGYRLTVKVKGVPEQIRTSPLQVPESMTLINTDGTSAIYYGEDALYNKTTRAPIPTGGMARGVLWFLVPRVSSDVIHNPETELTLYFYDAMQEEHSLKRSMTGLSSEAPGFIPGLRPPAVPPSPSPTVSPTASPSRPS